MKNWRLLLSIFLGTFYLGKAQTIGQDLDNFVGDMVQLSKGFVAPAATASVYQSTSAWTRTAKGLGKFKLDVSVHANVLPIPRKQRAQNVSNSDFNSLVIRGGQTTTSIPTALGGDTDVFFDFTIGGENYELQAFEGVDRDYLAHPYVQAAVGLWKETEVILRYSPKIKINASDYSIMGAAVKHNISQHFIKRDSANSNFELAVLASYSKFDLNLFFDPFVLESTNSSAGTQPLAVINSSIVDAHALLLQCIASKRFKKFEVLATLGYTRGDFNYKLGGSEGFLLDLFNRALERLEEKRNGVKGDLGVNYYLAPKWCLNATVAIGEYANTNMSIHYLF